MINIQDIIPFMKDEQWKALNGNMDSVMQTNQALCKKLAELKELLKECKEVFDECFSPSAKHGKLYKKIEEALK